jgi:hypothetical protein
MRTWRRIGSWSAAVVTFLATAASAAPKDETVLKIDQAAIDEDYLGMDFEESVRKLRQAIAICGKTGCSTKVVAQLQRDLGVVYVGWKHGDEGKAHFVEALRADPAADLPKELTTPDTKAAFAAAAEQTKNERKNDRKATEAAPSAVARETPRPKKTVSRSSDDVARGKCSPDDPDCKDRDKIDPDTCGADSDCPSGFCSAGRCASERPVPRAKFKKNWFGIAVQQDIVFLTSAKDVCLKGTVYACLQGNGAYYPTGQTTTLPGVQDEVKPGLNVATTRVLISYDRPLDESFSVGARLGYAFGAGPASPTGASFVPVHLEARAALWLGSEPFTRIGIRPYFVASFGFAQVDSGASVQVVETRQTGTLTAWRRAGSWFASGGLGFLYALGRNTGFVVEVRGQRMFPTSGWVIPLQLGYVVGI